MWNRSKHALGVAAVAAVVGGLVGPAPSAHAAATVLVENFDALNNTDLLGQDGWSLTGSTTTNPIQVGGATDKYAALGTSGEDLYKAFTTAVPHADGQSIETTFTLTASAAQATGDYFLHLSSPAGTSSNFYERVFAKSSGTGYVLGLTDTSGTGSITDYGTNVLSFGTAHTVDIVWNFVAGGTNNDTFTMNVDGNQYLTHAWSSTSINEPSTIEAVNLRQGSATQSATVQVDNINVTASAVPEPASLAAAATVGLLALGRRRRTR
jgi:hypothetical protein